EGERLHRRDLLWKRYGGTVIRSNHPQRSGGKGRGVDVGDPPAIARPGRLDVEAVAVAESRHGSTRAREPPDCALVREHDLIPVVRKPGMDRAEGGGRERLCRLIARRWRLWCGRDAFTGNRGGEDDAECYDALRDGRHGPSPRQRAVAASAR